MQNSQERIKIITEFQASEALSEIQKLTLANQNLNAQLEQQDNKTKEGKKARRELKDQIKENTKALNEHYKALGNDGLTSNQLANKLNSLKNQYKQLIPAAANYRDEEKKLRTEILNTTRALEARQQGLRQTDSIFAQLKKMNPTALVGGFAGGVAAMIMTAVAAIKSVVATAITSYAKITDTFATMRKASGLTEQGLDSLNAKLEKVDTRTAQQQLQEIVVVAGQMGIAKDQIEGFVKSTDKLVVALGDEFKGDAEEVTKVFGQMRNVLTDIKTDNVSNDMLHLGNAVNVLGASGMATGPVIADITSRIGSAGTVYGLTAGQVLGLAASYQEMAISTERGSTATVKILDKMSAAPEQFAKIAGMTTKDFRNLVNTNIGEAFLLVAKGFASSKGQATEFAAKLADAEISSASISEVLAKVGSNTDLVRSKFGLATDALGNTTSIMDEFNIKNETFQADIEKAEKTTTRWISQLGKLGAAIISPFIKIVASLGSEAKSATEKFNEQRDSNQQLITKTQALKTKYEELLPKINDNKTAQAELNKVIRDLGATVPGAGTSFDQYGNALTVNMGLVNQFIERQKILQKQMKASALEELTNENNKLAGERADLLRRLSNGSYAIDMVGRDIVNLPAEKAAANYKKIKDRIDEINASIQQNWKAKRDFDKEIAVTPPVPPKKTGGGGGSGISEDENKKQEELAKQRVENHAKTIAEIAKNEIELTEDTYAKRKASLEEEMRLYTEARNKELEENKLNQDDYDNALLSKAKLIAKQLEQIEKERDNKQLESALKVSKSSAEAELAEAENTGDEKEILAKKLALSIVEEQIAIMASGEEYHNSIHRNFAAQRAKLEIDLTKKAEDEKAKIKKKALDDQKEYEQARDEYERKISIDTLKNTEDAKSDFKKRSQQAFSEVAFSFVTSNIQNELSEEDKKYQRLIELNDQRLQAGTISEAEHAKRKLEIESQHDARVRELKRKQAIFDKAKAILDIAINTASGVVKAASGIVTAGMIPWIIATGAIEAAAVAAMPIPAFAQGGFTDTNKEYANAKPTASAKLAWVNEQGTEFMINNTGVRSAVFPTILPLLQAMNAGQNPMTTSISGSNRGVAGNTAGISAEERNFWSGLKQSIDRLNYNLENPTAPNLVVGYKAAEEILDAANEVKGIINNISA